MHGCDDSYYYSSSIQHFFQHERQERQCPRPVDKHCEIAPISDSTQYHSHTGMYNHYLLYVYCVFLSDLMIYFSVVSCVGGHQFLSMLLKIQLLFAIVLASTNYSAVVLQLRCLDDTGNELLTAIVSSVLIVSMFIAVKNLDNFIIIILLRIITLFIIGEKFTK